MMRVAVLAQACGMQVRVVSSLCAAPFSSPATHTASHPQHWPF